MKKINFNFYRFANENEFVFMSIWFEKTPRWPVGRGLDLGIVFWGWCFCITIQI